MTRQDKTRQDKTRQDKTRQDKTRQDKTRADLWDAYVVRGKTVDRPILHSDVDSLLVATAPVGRLAQRYRDQGRPGESV
ncbi:hypothetical protein ON010_g17234 [Phytophthora cinnamomi]|nr:hypothetical protein ON010_g17234 [Phytophthora cinnamomi]